MESKWLMYTAFPVLLGDPKKAGRAAGMIWRRHRVVGVWCGRRRSLSLLLYARRAGTDLRGLSDDFRVQALRDLAADRSLRTGLLALIPCSDDAQRFLSDHAAALEDRFVLLPMPCGEDGRMTDPLAPLIRSQGPLPVGNEVN